MTDEKFLFVTDCADKKRTARGIYNKRTHTGKGGKVRFPSDNLTRKELDAMNGEVVSYKLNEPMTWAEFKALPDDIKKTYIKLLREKFDVPDSRIAAMLKIDRHYFYDKTAELGLSIGEHRGRSRPWDEAGWNTFINKAAPVPVEIAAEIPVEDEPEEETPVVAIRAEKPKAVACSFGEIPEAGSLTFTGNVADILKTVGLVLSGGNVHMEINWTRVKGCVENG